MRLFRALRAAAPNLSEIQGDLFSRGFPKFYETYYFFSIQRPGDFSKALPKLVDGKHISSLAAVLGQWKDLDKPLNESTKEKTVTQLSNALIGFSVFGLKEIERGIQSLGKGPALVGLGETESGKYSLEKSDPAFYTGMKKDGPKSLFDPPVTRWDPLFQANIHGVLKVAGSDKDQVESRLKQLKEALGYDSGVIVDIPARSPPTDALSRVDGAAEKRSERLAWGREHFGFRDGISQPLMRDIDSDDACKTNNFMVTPQDAIIVPQDGKAWGHTSDTPPGDPSRRPPWMKDGSFLVFRKLEQHVKRFNTLLEKHKSVGCKDPEQLAAKLMGRWKDGTPIADGEPRNPVEPANSAPVNLLASNNFPAPSTKKDSRTVCSPGAHILKTNPRTPAWSSSRILRHGIPYGTPFIDKDEPRGLLFACYQSSIDMGFRKLQQWANSRTFGEGASSLAPGIDPIIGQSKETAEGGQVKKEDAMRVWKDDKGADFWGKRTEEEGLGPHEPVVTMKGGEYFFVPSLAALRGVLGT
ncbi:hypothetical protein B0T16DRAFT_449408 [Cercophora newfieldiana]|uniref:Dyp-type peroxidase n=1 Tax=Cercophora newfieldiana TaxID=92897 RepID=A0AA39Y037_9PEZI|nr:hypothetical protein B0T16DRAFT_449408 [Cercophora newfieldiana]